MNVTWLGTFIFIKITMQSTYSVVPTLNIHMAKYFGIFFIMETRYCLANISPKF